MKIWITRSSAFSIQCGGLERLHVWFSKPEFHLIKLEERERDLPFDDITKSEIPLYKKAGWYESVSKVGLGLSFGKVFGYDDGLNADFARVVWDCLKKHFLNKPFDEWHLLEIDGRCRVEDFLLEIEISPIKVLSCSFIK